MRGCVALKVDASTNQSQGCLAWKLEERLGVREGERPPSVRYFVTSIFEWSTFWIAIEVAAAADSHFTSLVWALFLVLDQCTS